MKIRYIAGVFNSVGGGMELLDMLTDPPAARGVPADLVVLAAVSTGLILLVGAGFVALGALARKLVRWANHVALALSAVSLLAISAASLAELPAGLTRACLGVLLYGYLIVGPAINIGWARKLADAGMLPGPAGKR